MFDSLVRRLQSIRGLDRPRVALFVDGPNVLRDEFDVDLDEHATPGLVRAAEARGFEVVVTSGDVDVKLAADAVATAADRRADTIAIVSRDTDFKPVLELARSRGCRTVAIAPGEYGRSDALGNAAHESIVFD